MMKAGVAGQLGNVIKLLQTQRWESAASLHAGFCQQGSLPYLFQGAQGQRSRGNYWETPIISSNRNHNHNRSWKCDASVIAKNARRQLVSWVISASVVNDSSCRHWSLIT